MTQNARVDRADRQAWLAMGVRDVLAEPFDAVQLPAQLRDLLGGPS